MSAIIKNGEIPDVVYATLPAPCPKCGGMVQENYRKFQCQKCDFSLWKVISGREWSADEVAELITKRFVGPLTGFRSQHGQAVRAAMRLNETSCAPSSTSVKPRDGEGDAGARISASQEDAQALPESAAPRVFEHRRGLRRARRRSGPRADVRLPLGHA